VQGSRGAKEPARDPASGRRDEPSALVRLGRRTARPARLGLLAGLPGKDDPLLVLLDVRDGAATFLLASETVRTTGDGTCLPSDDDCRRLRLRAGDVEVLQTTAPDGTVRRHRLEVVTVDAASARAARATPDARDPRALDGERRAVARLAVAGLLRAADPAPGTPAARP